MQQLIGDFIQVLRLQGLPISPAETLDALRATQLVGIEERGRLKMVLGTTLAKSTEHRLQLESLFDDFFTFGTSDDSTEVVDGDKNQNGESAADEVSSEPQSVETPPGTDGQPAESTAPPQSPLGQQLMSGDDAALAIAIASAAAGSGASNMQVFTQKSRVSYQMLQQLGEPELNAEIQALQANNEEPQLVQALLERREQLRTRVRDYVEQQYLLFTQARGIRLRESNLQKVKLTNVDHHYHQQMSRLVRKAAKQLAALHSRRRRVTKRGLLDVRKTIAANAAFDGFLFHTKWKSTRVERPKVVVLCDVSGSVARVARFLLLFLHSLQDVLPRVRSFVFASELGEVTDLFERLEMDEALAEIMAHWANRPTDYGQALSDFERLALSEIDNRTTVIMLGDARNNNTDGRTDIWQQVHARSQRVLWLNPEGRNSWNTGDSIMSEYAPYCSRVESCNSLRDLTRILGSLLKHS
ncbi:VWA domain-containing protein [Pseudomaricurvus alkylphenolicus]|uniref:VWA domain-containing protein n=1 Tax=Pseudomaricurvus alkylphenolicus TaxID=1306991 RepID=UPI00141F4B2D|nr:VWA domain-containing protein [Pseudomaricurvus alkylphenolicus]